MKRQKKYFFMYFMVVVVFCISVGYAAINRTLSITGSSEVRQNTWDVHFDNIQITDGSVTATTSPDIDDEKTIVYFGVYLNLPGDFYEFTVDVKNVGTIDAMIESIVKTPELTAEQEKYFNYIIEYQGGGEITTKQIVSKNDFVRLKVRLEYRTDITESDLPTIEQTLDLAFKLNYVQADDTGNIVKNHGIIGADGSLDEIGTVVTIGTEKFYTIGSDADNVKLLSVMNINTEGKLAQSLNPIDSVFASSSQKGTNYSDYTGSIVEVIANNYKARLEEVNDMQIEEARIITIAELTDTSTFACVNLTKCSTKYPWIYSTSYWIAGDAYNSLMVWYMSYNNFIGGSHYANSLGVRPVIIVSKDYFN